MKKISRRDFLKAAALTASAAALTACGQSVNSSSNSAANTGGAAGAGAGAGDSTSADVLKVGYVYIGDDAEAYTMNFIYAQQAVEAKFGGKVETICKYKVPEDSVESPLNELISAGCKVIFTTSYGYQYVTAEIAAANPDVQFYQATGDTAASEGLPNFHNAMGCIYQGRYVAGIVAGMKLKEQMDAGTIPAAKLGYVGAYDYAEVISGYTSFFMGVRSIVPSATMTVQYVGSWGDYESEYNLAKAMIDDGCVMISQHSDTKGPATACQEAHDNGKVVFCVCYNDDMSDVAPDCDLISSRIKWDAFEIAAVQAAMDGTSMPVDAWAGFEEDWVAMTDLNTAIAAEGTQAAIDDAIAAFVNGSMTATDVFRANCTATGFPYNPETGSYDETTIDLSEGFAENGSASAPAFCYKLNDGSLTVITG